MTSRELTVISSVLRTALTHSSVLKTPYNAEDNHWHTLLLGRTVSMDVVKLGSESVMLIGQAFMGNSFMYSVGPRRKEGVSKSSSY